MRKTLDFAWRLVATGFCFAVFGIGGIFMALVFFPVIALLSRSREDRRERIQKLVHHSFRLYLAMLVWLGPGRISVINGEQLARGGPALVLANHPTLLDVVILISLMPQADCVVKKALWRNPFLMGPVRGACYISNSSPDQLLADCTEVLSEDRALLLFPEGTRSVPGEPLRFQRGAARIALRSQAEIQPVTVTCDPPTLMKNVPWYRIPPRACHFKVMVHERIASEDLVNDTALPEPAAVRRMTKALQSLFERKIDEHEQAYRRVEEPGD